MEVSSRRYPYADTLKTAPLRQETATAARRECAAWLRSACAPESVIPRLPFLLSFTRSDNKRQSAWLARNSGL